MFNLSELAWMVTPFLACLVLSINHVYLGIHVIARKVIFVDLALAQIAALGATYAITLGYDPREDALKVSLFSLAFTFVGAGAFAIARMRKERVPQEAFIGIIYAAASAAAILILSKSTTGGEELKHMLVGDVLLVTRHEVFEMALLYAAIGLFHVIFRKQFLTISLDPETAEQRLNIRFWDILFYMSFGVVITKSVAIVGVLLVFSYLVVPAVIAQMWSNTVRGRLFMGWLVAIVASTFGILWSFKADYPTGPAVVVMLFLFLVLSGTIYYLQHAPSKLRAAGSVAAISLAAILFFAVLSQFRKGSPAQSGPSVEPVDLLLNEVKEDDEAHQLDGIRHLSEMRDPRIVPALEDLLNHTQSEEVIEAAVDALARQGDPRAAPALRKVAGTTHDAFLQLSIAKAQLAVGDKAGFETLIRILSSDGVTVARRQAGDLLERQAGRKFGYNADQPLAQNRVALGHIEAWWKEEGSRLRWESKTKRFVR